MLPKASESFASFPKHASPWCCLLFFDLVDDVITESLRASSVRAGVMGFAKRLLAAALLALCLSSLPCASAAPGAADQLRARAEHALASLKHSAARLAAQAGPQLAQVHAAVRSAAASAAAATPSRFQVESALTGAVERLLNGVEKVVELVPLEAVGKAPEAIVKTLRLLGGSVASTPAWQNAQAYWRQTRSFLAVEASKSPVVSRLLAASGMVHVSVLRRWSTLLKATRKASPSTSLALAVAALGCAYWLGRRGRGRGGQGEGKDGNGEPLSERLRALARASRRVSHSHGDLFSALSALRCALVASAGAGATGLRQRASAAKVLAAISGDMTAMLDALRRTQEAAAGSAASTVTPDGKMRRG